MGTLTVTGALDIIARLDTIGDTVSVSVPLRNYSTPKKMSLRDLMGTVKIVGMSPKYLNDIEGVIDLDSPVGKSVTIVAHGAHGQALARHKYSRRLEEDYVSLDGVPVTSLTPIDRVEGSGDFPATTDGIVALGRSGALTDTEIFTIINAAIVRGNALRKAVTAEHGRLMRSTVKVGDTIRPVNTTDRFINGRDAVVNDVQKNLVNVAIDGRSINLRFTQFETQDHRLNL